jgi:ubiquinone/menaquinone biosynthesis C-methylase UbiE
VSHQELNKTLWDSTADRWVESAKRDWASPEPCWGMWRVPEAEVGALPDVDGLDTIELGCGTAYFSAWLARRGARPVGVDQSTAQLATARAMQAEHGIEFPLIEADAENVPLPDASFDFALSEYGASLWCEPARWIAEAARLLRPGGRLVFLTSSPLMTLCSAPEAEVATERLARPQFGLHRVEWHDDDGPSVEFHLPHGELIRLLRAAGFEVEALHELQAPPDAPTRFEHVTLEWARSWPSEEIWVARKR